MSVLADTGNPFKDAMQADMDDRGINARLLGQSLGISQQAISKWMARGFPPLYRAQELIDYFGPRSHVAKLDFATLVDDPKGLRIAEPARAPKAKKPTQSEFLRAMAHEPPDPGMPPDFDSGGAVSPEAAAALTRRRAAAFQAIAARFAPLGPKPGDPAHPDTYREAVLTEVSAAMPRALRDHIVPDELADEGSIDVGGAKVPITYGSPTLVMILDTRAPGNAPPRGQAQALLSAAAVRQVTQCRVVYAVVGPAEEDPDLAVGGRRRALARAAGVEVWALRSGAELAHRLVQIEREDPPDTDPDD